MRTRRDRPVLGGACLAQVLSVLGAAEVGRDPRVEGPQAAGSRRWGWSDCSLQWAFSPRPVELMTVVTHANRGLVQALAGDDLHLISEPSLSESAPKRGLPGHISTLPNASFFRLPDPLPVPAH